jgi:tetratricopeptide (TPR) repeat protein
MAALRAHVLSKDRPFPGLRPFEPSDAKFFFGRDDQKFSLYRMVDRSRFVTVVGSSGSGKSSLVGAALLPFLEQENDEEKERGRAEPAWVWTKIRPGRAPLTHLTDAIAGLWKGEDEAIARALREEVAHYLQRSSFGIVEAVAELPDLGNSRVLIVVDQFEELFRYGGSVEESRSDAQKYARSRNEAKQFVQLLIEASRSSACKVHVLLTMRSDFIGDCAKFQGLPELVSGMQFLVPALSHSQREEVIRKPLKLAGATIEPELTERLLNDSDDELDQLPVLQHCLLRLWQKAGTAGEDLETAGTGRAEGEKGVEAASARRLSVAHYDAIGRMDGALSQHAEEVLSKLPGQEHIVELTFRALAEIDREGRAIRRGLPFRQLCAETGIEPTELSVVLDRFRADDCSFLTPSLSAQETLTADTPIDVGHEAFLRRWWRVSGKPGASNSETKGWLRAEADDGQTYRRLRATDKLHHAQVRKDWPWWKAIRRTPAWADRYGANYAHVERLLKDGQRARWIRIGAGLTAGVVVLAVGIGFAAYERRVQAEMARQQQEFTAQQTASAQAYYRLATDSAKAMMQRIQTALNRGALNAVAARELLTAVESILAQVPTANETAEITALRAEASVMIADAYIDSGDRQGASQFVDRAKRLAEVLAAKEPDATGYQHLLYRTLFRTADLLAESRPPDRERARKEYGRALEVIERIAAKPPGNPEWKKDAAFVYRKLGDLSQGQGRYQEALRDYNTDLTIMEQVVSGDRTKNFLWRRDLATAKDRVGQAHAGLRQYDKALEILRSALSLRRSLHEEDAGNATIQTHVATSHQSVADTLLRLNKVDDAISEYKQGIAMRANIARGDPFNSSKQATLARTLERAGDSLKGHDRMTEVIAFYEHAREVWKRLIDYNPDNPAWRQGLAAIERKIAEAKGA